MEQAENDIEIAEHSDSGYKTVISYRTWRVAVLNDSDKTTVSGIPYFQKHDLSDEVFVLMKGACTLFTAGQQCSPQQIRCTVMEPGKVYNVRRGTWHTNCLRPGSSVMIVENEDTGTDNSPISPITTEQRQEVERLYAQ